MSLLADMSMIALTMVLPEITALIPAADRSMAEQALQVPSLRAGGELADTLMTAPTAFDFIIANGIVLKQTHFAGRLRWSSSAPETCSLRR